MQIGTHWKWLFTTGFCLAALSIAIAQPGALIRKRLAVPVSPFQLDSLTLIASTLRCPSNPEITFSFDFKTNLVSVATGSFSGDSATFEYRTYSFAAYKPVYVFSRDLYDSIYTFTSYPGQNQIETERREELFALPDIHKSGTITRGISLGNNQGGAVSSSLNLQLEGQITPKIKLTAVLSDQNVPFQPQGNTQQIRELDRIFIQLDHQQGQLIAGDVVLKNDPSRFLRYYKNIQGGQFIGRWDSATDNSQTRVAAGIAKGKFASIVIAVKEGVQGPYRLRPPNNPDLLVVILANSERIYFDNRLLKRGFNLDYVIDYNTGELTLNNNRIITRFTRLRCDFEYAERNYSRTAWMGEHTEKIGFATVQLSHYQEQDNPNRPISFTLDSTSSKILALAGDDPLKAILPTAQAVSAFQEGQLLYTLKDTIINSQLYKRLVLAKKEDTNFYQVSFSEVGEGRGDYIFTGYLGNGKAFSYVGPGAGNYLPVRMAVLPNLRSVSRAALKLEPGKGHIVEMEGAWSRYDKNRLSSLDEKDNGGDAQYVGYQWKPMHLASEIKPEIEISYTRLSENFNAIDRFRPIEFDRDWNASSGDTLSSDDHLASASAAFSKTDKWRIGYSGAYRNKGKNVNGFQQKLDLQHLIGPFSLKHSTFAMQNSRVNESTDWYRIFSEISYPKYLLVPGYQYNLDKNRILRKGTDSIISTAMNYQSHTAFLRTKDTTNRILALYYTYREDLKPDGGELKNELFSQNGTIRAGTKIGEKHRVDLFGNYRNVRYAGLPSTNNEEIVSGRIDYSGDFLDGVLRQEFTYTANTSQEQKRTYQFVKINAVGEGTHQWIDYNGNGFQELDEFVEAQRTEDRQYIKIFTPTNELIKSYSNLLNYRLNLNAPGEWRSQTGFKAFISRFALLSSLTAEQKSIGGNLGDRYIPLQSTGKEEVISANRVFRNTIFWNRTQSNVGGEYAYLSSQQKTLLTNGFSLRSIGEHRFLVRKNLSSFVNLTNTVILFERALESDALVAQNYTIRGYELGPELSLQPNNSHRVTATGQFSDRRNSLAEEKTRLWKFGLEYRYNQQSNRTLNAFFRSTKINHTGNENSPASYELLEGLRPGQNLTWSLNVQQKLAQGLQILVSYEGRKSEGIKVIHIGKMQANLLF